MIIEGTWEGWARLSLAFLIGGMLPIMAVAVRRNWARGPTVATLCSVGPILLAFAHILTFGRPWLGVCCLGLAALASLLLRPRVWWRWLRRWSLPVLADLLIASVLGVPTAKFLFKKVWAEEWIYRDLMWHVGVVAEVRDHFPPLDPQWATGLMFEYHWLCHAVLAATSTILAAPAIEAVLWYAPSAVLVAAFGAAMQLIPARRRSGRSLGVLALALAFGTTWLPEWQVQKVLGSHLSAAMSTYGWSLPVVFGTMFWWLRWQRLREVIAPSNWRRALPTLLAATLLAIAASVSKGSHVLLVGGLELAALTVVLARTTLKSPAWLLQPRLLIRTVLPYLPIVLTLFIVRSLVFSSTTSDVVLRVEQRDYFGLLGSGLMLSSLDLWLVPLIAGWPLWKLPRRGWFFLIAAVINFIGFRVLFHFGSSDIYFAINALLLCAAALISTRAHFSALRAGAAFALVTVLALGLQSYGAAPNFIANAQARTLNLPYGQSLARAPLAELSSMRSLLDEDSLVSVPYSKFHSFEYAALLEARTWAGASRYSYVTNTPYAWNREGEVEEPEDRKKVERRFARSPHIKATECRRILKRHKWTHMVLTKKNSRKVSTCLKDRPAVKKDHWVLYLLSDPD